MVMARWEFLGDESVWDESEFFFFFWGDEKWIIEMDGIILNISPFGNIKDWERRRAPLEI